MSFIAGVVRADGTWVDIPAPSGPNDPVMSGWMGPLVGGVPTFKGKLDYLGNFWTITADNPNAFLPQHMYLVKITDNGDGTFAIAYKELPVFPFGDQNFLPAPTQLTVDKNGNVYVDMGIYATVTGYQTFNGALIIKVTPADWALPSLPLSIYKNMATGPTTYEATLCMCLNKAHTKGLCFLWNFDNTNGYAICEFDTATMTTIIFGTFPNTTFGRFNYPANIENCIGGINDDVAFTQIPKSSSVLVAYWDFATDGALDFTTNDFPNPDSATDTCGTAIDTLGRIKLSEMRYRYPPNPNRIYSLSPTAVRGSLGGFTQIDLNGIVPIEGDGNTTGMGMPQHHDILRTNNGDWLASGNPIFLPPPGGQQNGDIREITPTTQICKSIRARYLYQFTAGQREGHS